MSKKVQYTEAHYEKLLEFNAQQIHDAHAQFKDQCHKCPLAAACKAVEDFFGVDNL